jgi:hypothetical protein
MAGTNSSGDEEEGGLDMFTVPEGYYPPAKEPTFASHRMQNGEELKLRLVGHNPLWVGKLFHPVQFCYHPSINRLAMQDSSLLSQLSDHGPA